MKASTEHRFQFLVGLLSVFAVILVFRIVYLMTNEETVRLKTVSEDQYEYMTINVNSERGNIYDRNGYLLAGNTISYSVALNLQYANGHEDFIAEYLAPILNMKVGEIRSAAAIPYQAGTSVEATLTNYATKEQIDRLEVVKATLDVRKQTGFSSKLETLENLDAVVYYPNVHRYYPDNELAANIIGFFPFKDPSGGASYGIEQYYDSILSAKSITHRFSLDPNVPDRIPDLPDGASIVLTIDRKIQKIAEDIIAESVKKNEAKSGTILLMDPETGEVLSMATYPLINLNEYGESIDLFTRDNKYNPAVMQPYETGSVFKVITLAAAIDAGVVTPETVYTDKGTFTSMGVDIYNWDRGAWGPQTMIGCMQHSLNTCLSYMANLLGTETFYNYLDDFGLNEPTSIELAQEDYYPIAKPGDSTWTEINLFTNSFGQGLMTTPIQLTKAIGAIANDGAMMQPHIVREIRYDNHVDVIEPEVVGHPISAETAKTVTEMLALSIEIEASDASVDDIRIAGKTGTGEISKEGVGYVLSTTNASFVGWGPVDDPKFIAYVWLQEPKTNIWGSEVSAPVFSELINAVSPYLRLPNDRQRQCLYTDVCPTEEPDDYYW